MRCARCGHTWSEQQPEDMPRGVGLEAATDEPAPIHKAPNLAAAREREGDTGWVGWAALALIVVGVVGGGVLARERIVAAWPPAAKLYEMVRLPVERAGPGLELLNVRSSQEMDDGAPVLVIKGEIVNVSDQVQAVPKLRIVLRDEARREVEESLFSVAQPSLEPGQKTAFSQRWERPPAQARGLVVTFEGAD